MFGTDGIRGPVGTSPFTFEELHQLGKAIGKWIIQTHGSGAQVLVGHDTRLSCAWVKAALKSGLLMHPLHIHDASIFPTPGIVQRTVQDPSIACGIIVSASHNPFADNGIKIVDGASGKLSLADEQCITTYFGQDQSVDYAQLGTDTPDTKSAQAYIDTICHFFEADLLAGKTIVLDCAHGATYALAPHIFRQLGAEVITIGDQPNGININEEHGALHLERLQQKVLECHADAGFAFDGDGDRVIAVNCHGQIKDGDDILVLLHDHPNYRKENTIVGTIMSNQGLAQHIANKGGTLARTPVGDKYIARHLKEHDLMLGGEQSGHIICNDYLCSGDGIFTALRVMQALHSSNNPTMQTFIHMPQQLINVRIKHKKELTEEPFASIIKKYTDALTGGRLLVRYSGTEPLLRVMVEESDAHRAITISTQCAQELQQALEGI